MKLLAIVIPALILFCSCKSDETRNREHVDSIIEEANAATKSLRIKALADSIMKADTKQVMFDTVGIAAAPVIVTEAKFIQKDYLNAKDMHLKFKNVSGKKNHLGVALRSRFCRRHQVEILI
jgi:hypothetical protein